MCEVLAGNSHQFTWIGSDANDQVAPRTDGHDSRRRCGLHLLNLPFLWAQHVAADLIVLSLVQSSTVS
jgi:hypothetical protein